MQYPEISPDNQIGPEPGVTVRWRHKIVSEPEVDNK